jgi:hypothetical protein
MSETIPSHHPVPNKLRGGGRFCPAAHRPRHKPPSEEYRDALHRRRPGHGSMGEKRPRQARALPSLLAPFQRPVPSLKIGGTAPADGSRLPCPRTRRPAGVAFPAWHSLPAVEFSLDPRSCARRGRRPGARSRGRWLPGARVDAQRGAVEIPRRATKPDRQPARPALRRCSARAARPVGAQPLNTSGAFVP